jgi:tetratricopeptide (TPR) repeat protein
MRAVAAAIAMFVAGIGTAAAAQAVGASAAQRRIFEDYGGLSGATEAEGAFFLSLWEPHVRYRIDRESGEQLNALTFLLRRANEGSRAITLRYDGSQGRLNRKTGTLDYPVCGIVLDDLKFEPTRHCEDEPAGPPPGPEAALMLARAHFNVGDYRLAQDLLPRTGLPDDEVFRKLLLRIRADAADGVATLEEPASPAADRSLAASLADYRALALLEPDDVEHQFAIATRLRELGGYAEARATYDRILAKWPDESYRVAVGIGALHRVQGEYAKALDSLNQLVAREGPQEGMKYHYHRAWTLSLLERFDEAIRELGEGMRSQPDYSSAYQRRACAYASVGRIREALADAEEARRLFAALPGAATSRQIQEDIAEVDAMRGQLQAALATGEAKPVAGTCRGPMWDSWEHPRPRSPLLPAA